MNELKVDPKLVADQLGHTLDVNQNVYTIPNLARRQEDGGVMKSLTRDFEVCRLRTVCSLLIRRAGDGDRTRYVQLGKLGVN